MEIAKGTPDYEEVQSFYEEQPVDDLLYAIATSNVEEDLGHIPFRRIRQLCSKTSCVLIGRCGGHIFRGEKRAVSIFLHADENIRAQRTMQDYGLSLKKPWNETSKQTVTARLFTDTTLERNGEPQLTTTSAWTAGS